MLRYVHDIASAGMTGTHDEPILGENVLLEYAGIHDVVIIDSLYEFRYSVLHGVRQPDLSHLPIISTSIGQTPTQCTQPIPSTMPNAPQEKGGKEKG